MADKIVTYKCGITSELLGKGFCPGKYSAKSDSNRPSSREPVQNSCFNCPAYNSELCKKIHDDELAEYKVKVEKKKMKEMADVEVANKFFKGAFEAMGSSKKGGSVVFKNNIVSSSDSRVLSIKDDKITIDGRYKITFDDEKLYVNGRPVARIPK